MTIGQVLAARDASAAEFTQRVAAAIAKRGKDNITTHVETKTETLPDDIWVAIKGLTEVSQQLKTEMADIRAEMAKARDGMAAITDTFSDITKRLVALEGTSAKVDNHQKALRHLSTIAQTLTVEVKGLRNDAMGGIDRLVAIAGKMQDEIKQTAGIK